MGTIVRYRVDLSKPPVMTDQQRAELRALKSRPDSDIDYSDIPPLTDKFFENAIRNPYFKATKTATTVRLDSDVLHWLRSQGKGYQTRINAILRREMLTALASGEDQQGAK
jgi:uncharacterized protein (DUF4415 family)